MFKAAHGREKDRRDAEVTLPLLDDRARGWLSRTVARMDSAHPWATGLRTADPAALPRTPVQAVPRVRDGG